MVGRAELEKALDALNSGQKRPDTEINQATLRIAAETSINRRTRILSDLITIAMADNHLAQEEVNVLAHIAQALEIPYETFKEQLQPWLISKPKGLMGLFSKR